MNVERFITIEYIMDYNLYVIIIPCVIFFTILLLVNNQSLCPICRAKHSGRSKNNKTNENFFAINLKFRKTFIF